jgi:hypothetical protein
MWDRQSEFKKMRVRNITEAAGRWTVWHVCVSVILIGLVLYNPFFVLASHSDGLAYQTLACHRATVGASEMQHYAPVQEKGAQSEVTVEEIFPEFVVEHEEYPAPVFQEEALPQRPELIASFWFRPPPTL